MKRESSFHSFWNIFCSVYCGEIIHAAHHLFFSFLESRRDLSSCDFLMLRAVKITQPIVHNNFRSRGFPRTLPPHKTRIPICVSAFKASTITKEEEREGETMSIDEKKGRRINFQVVDARRERERERERVSRDSRRSWFQFPRVPRDGVKKKVKKKKKKTAGWEKNHAT